MAQDWSRREGDGGDAEPVVWASSDASVRIVISKPMLEDLRAEAYRARYGNPRAPVEVGGVLYGRQTKPALEVHAWAPIACSWSYGPTFRLNESEQGGLSCLLDGLVEPSRTAQLEVVGWFVSRTRADRTPTESDLELHTKFFASPGSVLLILEPRREGEAWTTVHCYDAGSGELRACEPMWLIDPARLPAQSSRERPRAHFGGRRRASPEEGLREEIEGTGAAAAAPAAARATVDEPAHEAAAIGAGGERTRVAGSAWDAVPFFVWRLLALVIFLAIAGAAWLWLFEADIVRPLLTRWITSTSAPPSSLGLTARLAGDRLTVQWQGGSRVFLNPVSVKLVFEFAAAEPTTVTLRPDEAQRGYFMTLTNLPPRRVTMKVMPSPGHEISESFEFPPLENGAGSRTN